MAISAMSGPLIIYGQSPFAALEYNPDLGSSLFYSGAGILDPRQPFTYLPGEAESQPDVGWLGFDNITTLTAVTYTKAVGAISSAGSTTGSATYTLPLVTANSATTGVYVTQSFTRSDTGVADTNTGAGLVALDAFTSVTASITNGIMTVTANSAMPITPGMIIVSVGGAISLGAIAGVYVVQQLTAGAAGNGVAGTYQLSLGALTVASGTITLALPNVLSCAIPYGFSAGTNPSIPLWNPSALVGRAVQITVPASPGPYGIATVSGYDIYGYPMVEAITLGGAGAYLGKKAFRYIRSIVLSGGTPDTGKNYTADTTDIIGLPLRSDNFGDLAVNYAASLTALTGITAATNYVASDRTSPATSTTGDVRGTFGAFTSATGTSKLVIRQSPQAQNVGYTTGLYGVTQFSNF
jgi:hypothetical protein